MNNNDLKVIEINEENTEYNFKVFKESYLSTG